MSWEPSRVALWGRDRDSLAQEPDTTSGMAGTEVAVWNFDSVLKCSGSPESSGNSAFC